MADKKLNEVTKVTDMAYVPVIMADGSIGQIAKADLASVVAGLTVGIVKKGRFGGDLDELFEEGIYRMADTITNIPDGGWLDSPIFVFNAYSSLTVQVVFLMKSQEIKIRFYDKGWSTWKVLS